MNDDNDWIPVARVQLLCRTCRWCRPSFSEFLALPVIPWLVPELRRSFWEGAHCRHPKCVDRPSPTSIVTGHQRKPYRMFCSAARGRRSSYRGGDERCGPDAEYFEPRRMPWLLPWITAVAGIAMWTAYGWGFTALMRFVARH